MLTVASLLTQFFLRHSPQNPSFGFSKTLSSLVLEMSEEYNKDGMLRLVWSKDAAVETDVIAVHGLRGTYANTWCKARKSEFAAPLEQFTYQARIFAFHNEITEDILFDKVNLEKVATALLQEVSEKVDKKRSLVFICHNLGGILVKELLWIANHDKNYLDIALATKGIVCFGTPVYSCDWNAVLSKLVLATAGPRVDGHSMVERLELSGLLKRGASTLKAACGRYEMIENQYKTVSLFEKAHPWHWYCGKTSRFPGGSNPID
ncbi:hypothetical protein F4818DRAFT_450902 [Hypoxylon cercidicola]|nr:hypothetical protein F4818DRAFT_450902 [Hypoxylon cercidicola]